jgi:hypothetical protein
MFVKKPSAIPAERGSSGMLAVHCISGFVIGNARCFPFADEGISPKLLLSREEYTMLGGAEAGG